MFDVTNEMLVCRRNVLPYYQRMFIFKCRYLNAEFQRKSLLRKKQKTGQQASVTSVDKYTDNKCDKNLLQMINTVTVYA